MSDSTIYMDEAVGKARQDRTCCSVCEGFWNDTCVYTTRKQGTRKSKDQYED